MRAQIDKEKQEDKYIMKEGRSIETILAHAGTCWDEHTGAVSMPVFQTATFRHPALGQSTGYDYSRSGNPNRTVLEETMALLEGGERALAFSSGMAAIDCFLRLLKPGDTVIATEDPYGGTVRLLEKVYREIGIEVKFIDTSDLKAVKEALHKRPKAIFVESPTNPLLKIADIRAISEAAQQVGALTVVDNTFLTSWFQKPLALGADIVIYSATKYLSGHNDVLAGLIVAKTKEMGEKLYFYQNSTGAVPGPWDCWLVLRGLKTLSLRLDRQQHNAQIVAEWLTRQPQVKRVFYPGLKTHPGHALLESQSSGSGSIVSFEVKDPGLVPRILSSVEVFLFAESLGGVESLITFPAAQTHAEMDVDVRLNLGINDCLLRLSLGIEDVQDLMDDLGSAING
ncbi:MAG: Cystathionine gamma-lyase [Syntrophorhabdaceae bacterium PtaU1.Bin034]|nr:MAG: Cystathionine gamma-lyase [Syntrophorhabdaceae bacterium PtaU1.Bin034]